MADDSHQSGKAEADKLLTQIETKFLAIQKQIEIFRKAGGDHPGALQKIDKLGQELRGLVKYLDDSFSIKGPYKDRVAKLKKIAASSVKNYKGAFSAGSASLKTGETVEKKQAKTTAFQMVKVTKDIASQIKPLGAGVELAGQIALIAEVVRVAFKKYKQQRPKSD